jgi:hypothetical protein
MAKIKANVRDVAMPRGEKMRTGRAERLVNA